MTKWEYNGPYEDSLEHGLLSDLASGIKKRISSLKGREMPNHKYIRREMMPNGRYKYVYDKNTTALSEYRNSGGIGKATAVEGTNKKRRGVKYLYKERTSNGWRYYYENKEKTLANLEKAKIDAGKRYAEAVLARQRNDNEQTRAAEKEAWNAATTANINASVYGAVMQKERESAQAKEQKKERARARAMEIVNAIKQAIDKKVTERDRKRTKVTYQKGRIEGRG